MDGSGIGGRTTGGWARPVALLAMVVSTVVLPAAPAGAAVVAVGGGAFGVSAGSVAAPQPAVSFTQPPDGPGPFTASAPSASFTAQGAGFVAGNLQVSTAQVGTLGTAGAGSHSTADLGQVQDGIGVISAVSVHSECTATAGGGASGSTTFGSINYFQNQGVVAQGNFSPAPNTTVNNGFGATIVFNEQTPVSTGQTTGIVVNAMRITAGGLDIVVGQSRCTVTDAPGVPHTTLSVAPAQLTVLAPSGFTFTYTEVNDGDHPIANVTVTDSMCAPVTRTGGDTDADNVLDPGETWTFTCSVLFTIPGSFTSSVTATGVDTVTNLTHVEQASSVITVFMGMFDPITGMWIDPSGTVCASSAATVTLFRSDTAAGPFVQVPSGSVIMSPDNRVNPDTPRPDGSFRWDVVQGFYLIRLALLDGSESVDSDVLPIPPEVTGLSLRLRCPTRAPAATPTRPATLALTGDSAAPALAALGAGLVGLGAVVLVLGGARARRRVPPARCRPRPAPQP